MSENTFEQEPSGLAFWLVQVGEMTLRDVRSYFQPFNINPLQFGILHACRNQSTTLTAIARLLPVGPSAISRQVDILFERGLLDRVPGMYDRRVINLVLTDAGRELLTQLVAVVVERETRIGAGLNDEELAALISYARRVCGNLEELQT